MQKKINIIEKLALINGGYINGVSKIFDSDYESMLFDAFNKNNVKKSEIEKTYQKNKQSKNINYILHPTLILKINKYYDINFIYEKYKKTVSNSSKILIEQKLDGIMINSIYINNKLIHSLTRGDKKSGQSILPIVEKFLPFKINIDGVIELRSELLINNDIYKKKYSNFTSSRHALISFIKNQLYCEKHDLYFDPNIINDLSIIIHGLNINLKNINDFNFIYNFCKTYKLTYVNHIHCNFENLIENYNKFQVYIDTLNEPNDGVIIKFINNEDVNKLDKYVKNYGSIIAIKKIKNFITVVNEIVFSMNKKGAIIPSAVIDKIEDDLSCKKISLYSIGFLINKSINIGSVIDIIFNGVFIFNKLISNPKVFSKINCFSCNKELFKNKLHYYCINHYCKEKLISILSSFTKKTGIKNISKKTIKSLVDKGIIENIFDFLTIEKKYNDLFSINGFRKKKINNIVNTINNSIKNLRISDLIYSFGISEIGEDSCLKLAEIINNIENVNINNIIFLNKLQKLYLIEFLKNIDNICILKKTLNLYFEINKI